MTTQADADLAFGTFFHQMDGLFRVEQLFECLSDFSKILGHPLVAYGASTYVHNPLRKSGNKLQTMSNYPAAWQEHCLKEGYDRLGPIVAASRSQSLPLRWDEVYADPKTTDRERRIFDDAKNFGLKAGVTVPLRGQGGIFSTMSFVQKEASGLKDFEINYLQFAAWLFHLKIVNTFDCNDERPSLTGREKECLSWVAKGKSSWDISGILGISANTINYHIKNAMRKLKTGNRIVAVLRAARFGLIEVQP
ncbi:LuxR family transcriptional regulator [Rhizobium leguminosarum]|uniref:helix-turn-helix transcriptional regulator n=1 Tax=Rhizobium TaxID=379 RepID=UPI001C84075D|nr:MULTISPECIES: LuxR family transcriptional regulator [Rhizobium]MBX5177216.1 LuxR family transcriptional regulator [Rhizobium lentis]MBY2994855.1 LuxR family transcriptional regulator [Rhizobium leguminosarum]MBY3059626.1 LuxR family transcriptional regulator [Rhizobium leguminosarum]MBY3143236.1 LuxR family transcriptional regulator [Rhizobium laguerreae]